MVYYFQKSNFFPFRGLPLSGSLCIYFFFLDFLDFFCFISWRAVKVKTKISTKSFTISSISCMVSIPLLLSSTLYLFVLFSFLCFNYIPFSVYRQGFFYIFPKKKHRSKLLPCFVLCQPFHTNPQHFRKYF